MDWITERIAYHVEQMGMFGKGKDGTTRLPFTKENRMAADYLKKIMETCELEVEEDVAGNIYGKWEIEKGKNYIAIGSHYDSVINGGKYDGVAGIVVGLVLVENYRRENKKPKHNLMILAFNDEEGVRFGTGFFGSRVFLQDMTRKELMETKDRQGISIFQAMKEYGKNPEKLHEISTQIDQIEKYIEIHVEQGPVLDQRKKEIGLVHTIVGMQRYSISVVGESNHAGTTPMNLRKDPTKTACQIIASMIEMGEKMGENSTVTVGYMQAFPGAINIIPHKIEFSLDFRSVEEKNLLKLKQRMKEKTKELCERNHLTYQIEQKLEVSPIAMSKEIWEKLYYISEQEGFSTISLPSGAGHDALPMAAKVNTALLFVPSKKGVSHCKEEYTSPNKLRNAVVILKKYLEK
jgi:allantoate deiminase